jgi:hypothetical protein
MVFRIEIELKTGVGVISDFYLEIQERELVFGVIGA